MLTDLSFWDRAAGEYRDAVRIRPVHLGGPAQLGQVLLRSGEELAAVKVLIRATKERPQDPELLVTLGRSYEGLGREPDAAAACRRYIALAPDVPSTDEVRTRTDGLTGSPQPHLEASRHEQVGHRTGGSLG